MNKVHHQIFTSFLILAMALTLMPAQSSVRAAIPDPVINEFSANTVGSTDVEYVEIYGTPNTDYSAYKVLQIEGDFAASAGMVDRIISLGTTDANGLYLVSLASGALENGSLTLLLVLNFTGAAGQDLDTSGGSSNYGDGVFDTTPWEAIVDALAVNDGGASDLAYGIPVLGVSYDGLPGAPGGASRIPDGADTGTAADWVRNDFDLAGIPTYTGTIAGGEAYNTPGATNIAYVMVADWVINEIHADPDTFLGDANGDGSVNTSDDEFIEIVNNSGADVDISGWTLSDGVSLRHTFPANTVVPADCSVVVFGGGTPTGIFGFSVVQSASTSALGLNNTGDTVTLNNGTGDVASYTYGSEGGDNQSLTRDPDVTGFDPLVKHTTATGFGGVLYSPGTMFDGGQFTGCVGSLKIHDIQGNSLASPLDGKTVEVEGIVVGDFQDGVSGTNGDLDGFNLQEEDAEADTDPLTSEGIFVYDGSSPVVNVAIGDHVKVVGKVSEFNGLTELISYTGVTVISSGNPLPAATPLSLPAASADAFEAYEGMLVIFPQSLVIADSFNFDRFGEIVLTSQRRLTPTAEFGPGPASIQAAADFLLDSIILDDGRAAQNPDPAIHPNGGIFNLTNLFRSGDTLQNVTGVMDYGFDLYRIQPTRGADYTAVNPRPAQPDDVGGSLRVASFNLMNYFSSIDAGPGNWICGPDQIQECRGADTPEEFARQRAKTIAAITGAGADVIGVLEMENHVNDDALKDLVNGLNALNGAGAFSHIDTGVIGTDAIKVALIYKPTSITPVGNFAILDSSVDARFLDTKNRPSLAQTFKDNATGGMFTVVINHFKSKGSDCNDVGDPDLGDGAGNCNITRTQAAQALVDWLATDPTGSGVGNYLIIGDLNSYDKEDPIDAIKTGSDDTAGTADDYTDMVFQFQGENAYSYVFDGQVGYLDHVLASAGLAGQITGVTDWHINSDEPDLIDYDMSFKLDPQDALYEANAYRSSDHDPVIVGLELDVPPIDVQPRTIATFQSRGRYDGWILENGNDPGTGGKLNRGSAVFFVGDNSHNRQYRSILSFDTSGIPDNAVITKVTLVLQKAGQEGTDPFKFNTHGSLRVDIRKGKFHTMTHLQLADFQARASRNGVGTVKRVADTPVYKATLGSTAYRFINRDGTTQLRLRFSMPDNNDDNPDYVKFYSGNAMKNQPQLIVEYYVP